MIKRKFYFIQPEGFQYYEDEEQKAYEEWLQKLRKKQKLSKSNLLKDNFPQIFEELHPTKNVGVDVNSLTSGSNKKLWFICKKSICSHHQWLTTANSRTQGKKGLG